MDFITVGSKLMDIQFLSAQVLISSGNDLFFRNHYFVFQKVKYADIILMHNTSSFQRFSLDFFNTIKRIEDTLIEFAFEKVNVEIFESQITF